MSYTAKLLFILMLVSSGLFAQSTPPPPPCNIGNSTATIGQVPTATAAGRFPPCTWQNGGGGGGSGTVTSVSVTTANGVSGTVANPTTTPAITLNLGAITPTSVTTSGSTAGTLSMVANATPGSVVANAFGFTAPATITTSEYLQPPNAVPAANSVMLISAPTSNVSTFVYTNTPTLTGTNFTGIPGSAITGGTLTRTIGSGSIAIASTTVGSAACSSALTATVTGTLTTDNVMVQFSGDPTAVVGFIPATAGMMAIIAYPTADTVNVKLCNNTSSSITTGSGAPALNVRVVR